jgi:hypothetical protein
MREERRAEERNTVVKRRDLKRRWILVVSGRVVGAVYIHSPPTVSDSEF